MRTRASTALDNTQMCDAALRRAFGAEQVHLVLLSPHRGFSKHADVFEKTVAKHRNVDDVSAAALCCQVWCIASAKRPQRSGAICSCREQEATRRVEHKRVDGTVVCVCTLNNLRHVTKVEHMDASCCITHKEQIRCAHMCIFTRPRQELHSRGHCILGEHW